MAVATTNVTGDVLMYIRTEVFIKTGLDFLYNIRESHTVFMTVCTSVIICEQTKANKTIMF